MCASCSRSPPPRPASWRRPSSGEGSAQRSRTRAAAEAAAALRPCERRRAPTAQAEGALKASGEADRRPRPPPPRPRQRAEDGQGEGAGQGGRGQGQAGDRQSAGAGQARGGRARRRRRQGRGDGEGAGRPGGGGCGAAAPCRCRCSSAARRSAFMCAAAHHPVFEAPVAISDADKPIGTFVFTALDHQGTQATCAGAWWPCTRTRSTSRPRRARTSPAAARTAPRRAAPTDVAAAKAALDRITIGKETLDIIVGDAVLPGASLIVSDEGPSREIGKDTDFILIMSGEPQGALKVRQREPIAKDYFDESPWGSPWGSGAAASNPRGRLQVAAIVLLELVKGGLQKALQQAQLRHVEVGDGPIDDAALAERHDVVAAMDEADRARRRRRRPTATGTRSPRAAGGDRRARRRGARRCSRAGRRRAGSPRRRGP